MGGRHLTGMFVPFALYGALALVVSRYCGRDDVCLGTTSSGRNRVDLEPLIGFFINILPWRLQVDEALPGGLAIYGSRFGRYPVDPTVPPSDPTEPTVPPAPDRIDS